MATETINVAREGFGDLRRDLKSFQAFMARQAYLETKEVVAEQEALDNEIDRIDVNYKTVSNVEAVKQFTRSVRVVFLGGQVDVFVNVAVNALRKQIRKSTNQRTGKLLRDIKVILAPAGEAARVVGTSGKYTLKPGDQILVLPGPGYWRFLNLRKSSSYSRKRKRKGKSFTDYQSIAVRASRMVRRVLRTNRQSSALTVSASPSKVPLRLLNFPKDEGGSPRGGFAQAIPCVKIKVRG